jgi:hypothetical protein
VYFSSVVTDSPLVSVVVVVLEVDGAGVVAVVVVVVVVVEGVVGLGVWARTADARTAAAATIRHRRMPVWFD